MNKKNILVTGANGQLGRELQLLAHAYPGHRFFFADKDGLTINDSEAVKKYFTDHQIDCCINCAAYTAVDKAESEKEKAFLINGTAVGGLAAVCNQQHSLLIHISTDYVFDGKAQQPYRETDEPCPANSYGESKLKGEQLALQNNPDTIIIRTSWLYSSFGNNFVSTMLRLMKERESINVVNDQYGCPTYAVDLVETIMTIVEKWADGNGQSAMGNEQWATLPAGRQVFNYCNSGVISWFEFALAIKELTGSGCIINPIPTSQYPTAAKRPAYSVLDTTKIQNAFQLTIPGWKQSLEKCLSRLN